MKRKLFVSLLAVMLVMGSLSQTVFADFMDEVKQSSNTVVMVSVDNPSCLELENLKDLKVHLACEEAGLDITVPVEEFEFDGGSMGLWLGYPSEKISDAIMNKLAELQDKIDFEEDSGELPDMEDAGDIIYDVENLLTDVKITVEGLPEGHYVVDSSAVILTHEVFKEAVDLIMEAAKEELGEVNSFSELFDKLMKEFGLDLDEILDTSKWTEEDWAEFEEMGITAEDIENIKSLIKNIDPFIEYLTSEEFSGILIANAELTCDCPEVISYCVEHRYYERVNGKLKLVGTVDEGEEDEFYMLKGIEGTTISAKDFKQAVYKGRTYQYMGSYNDEVLYDDYKWKEYEQDSFVLGDDDCFGLVLRYVYDKDGSVSGDSANGSTSTGNGETAPPTGDETPIGAWVLLLAAAGLALTVLLRRKEAEK